MPKYPGKDIKITAIEMDMEKKQPGKRLSVSFKNTSKNTEKAEKPPIEHFIHKDRAKFCTPNNRNQATFCIVPALKGPNDALLQQKAHDIQIVKYDKSKSFGSNAKFPSHNETNVYY